MRISACFITKNEEQCLARALASIKDIVDEIIVVDTGSEDNTVKIARQYTKNVYGFIWQDNFALAKNYAIEKANADWIIFLDADEYFKSGCQRAIRGYMEKYLHSEVEALGCKKHNIDTATGYITSTFPEVRIFKNKPEIRYRGMIHERLDNNGKDLKIMFLGEEVVMYHTGYSSNIVGLKLERNLRILEKEISLYGIKPIHYRYLCDCFYGLQKWEKAYINGKKYIEVSDKKDELGVNVNLYIKILKSLNNFCSDSVVIEKELKSAIGIYPDYPEFYMYYADFLNENTEEDKALEYYLLAIKKDDLHTDRYSNNFYLNRAACCVEIGKIYIKKKKVELAVEYFVQGLKINKYAHPALKMLIEAMGDNAECIVILNHIYDKNNALDMTFLEHYLEKISIGAIYIYYQKYFIHNNLNKDKQQMYLYLAMNKMKNVTGLVSEKLKKQQNRLFFICLEEGNLIKKYESALTPNYMQLLKYVEEKRKKIDSTLLQEYLDILTYSILHDKKNIIALIQLVTFSSINFKLIVVDLLISYGCYREAGEVYKFVDEKLLAVEQVENKAVCLYKQHKYMAAKQCFTRALKFSGKLSNKAQSFYNWCTEKKESYKNITSIVILTYNKLEYTKLCIDSVRKYTEDGTYEIIVVDNNSTDETVEWLSQQNDLRVIFNDSNLGFPKGCNQGIEIALGKQILLLNNDTIVTEGWLENLNSALYSNDYIGATGAVSNSCSNYQSISVDYQNIEGISDFSRKISQLNKGKYEKRARLIGFCMLIKRCIVEEIGLLDEIFTPGNFEDDDYSCRIRLAGYELLLCRDVFIHHFGSASFNGDGKHRKFIELLKLNESKFKDKWGYSALQMIYINNKECEPSSDIFSVRLLSYAISNNQDLDWRNLKEWLAVAHYSGKEIYNFLINLCNININITCFSDIVIKIGNILDNRKKIVFFIEAYNNNYRNESFLNELVKSLLELKKFSAAQTILIECERQFKNNEIYGLEKDCRVEKSLPLVSILIPTYNRLSFFKEALRSAVSQSYPNVEIIVCDNSSNEDTFAYMQLFRNHPRVKYFRNRLAQSKRENFMPFKDLANGDYIQWLMDDDMLSENKLTEMSSLLLKNQHVTLVTSYRTYIDAQGKLLPNSYPPLKTETCILNGKDVGHYCLINMQNYIGEPSAVLFRRVDLINHYWEAVCRDYHVISDVAMWLELLEKGNLAYVIDPLSSFRKHSGQEQNNINVYLKARNEWFKLAKEYFERRIYIANESDYETFLNNFILDNSEVEENIIKFNHDLKEYLLDEYRHNLRFAEQKLNIVDERNMKK